MPRHKKFKAQVIKDINTSSNSRQYKIGEIIEISEIKAESEYYQIIFIDDIDIIPKSYVKII